MRSSPHKLQMADSQTYVVHPKQGTSIQRLILAARFITQCSEAPSSQGLGNHLGTSSVQAEPLGMGGFPYGMRRMLCKPSSQRRVQLGSADSVSTRMHIQGWKTFNELQAEWGQFGLPRGCSSSKTQCFASESSPQDTSTPK